ENCAVWPSSHFLVSLHLVDLCDSPMRLESVILEYNPDANGTFVSNLPLDIQVVSKPTSRYYFPSMAQNPNLLVNTSEGTLEFESALHHSISSLISVKR